MDDREFDAKLITSAFGIAAHHGWRALTIGEAARAAGLPLSRARSRFPGRTALLLRFGRLMDESALEGATAEGTIKDRLFDLLMRRFDAMQEHRGGVLALLRALPAEPQTALLLALATRGSMRWMLDAAGIDTSGLNGELHARGLMAVWLWTVRAWRNDPSPDLAATMASLDTALERAGSVAEWFPSAVRVGSAPTSEKAPGSAPGGGNEPASVPPEAPRGEPPTAPSPSI